MNEELIAQTHYRLIEALAREEQSHRRRLDHLQDVVFETVSEDGVDNLVYLNPAWERLVGFRADDSLGRPFREFVVPEDHETWDTLSQGDGLTTQPRPVELRLRHIRQGCVSVELTASRGQDGSWVGSLHDLTERNRQTEASLSRSRVLEHLSAGGSLEELLRALAQHLAVLIPAHPVSILLVNEHRGALERAADIGLPEGYARAVQTVAIGAHVGACGSAAFLKRRVIIEDTEEHPDWRPFRELSRKAGLRACCSQPVFSSRGAVIATLALYGWKPGAPGEEALRLLGDTARLAGLVIEQKQTESQLLRHSVAVQQSPVAVFVTDVKGVIEYVNPRFVELTGYTEAESIGKTPRILKSGLHAKEHYERLWSALLANQVWRGEFCNRKKSGEHFWQSIAIAPIRDRHDRVTGFVSIGEDISSQKEAARQLQLALLKEQEAGELKGRFISMTSHEFRTPMSAIQLSVDLLREACEVMTCSRRGDLFARIDTSVQRMKRMLDASLMVSRTETGRMPFNTVPTDLVELVLKIIAECRQTAGPAHDISLDCRFEQLRAKVDPDICWNILTNLLRNACAYSRPGTIITVRLDRGGDRLVLAVEDHGIGIPEADQPRLFTSFERGSNVGTIKGTGLGLSIVKRLVEVHGGNVTLRSKLGVGTTFTVTLPDPPMDPAP